MSDDEMDMMYDEGEEMEEEEEEEEVEIQNEYYNAKSNILK